jgi:hypothetical protein
MPLTVNRLWVPALLQFLETTTEQAEFIGHGILWKTRVSYSQSISMQSMSGLEYKNVSLGLWLMRALFTARGGIHDMQATLSFVLLEEENLRVSSHICQAG